MEEKQPITKHQRYYRKNRERRKKEWLQWYQKDPFRAYLMKRTYKLKKERKRIQSELIKLQEENPWLTN